MNQAELPYFDQVLKQLSAGDPAYAKAWGRHVHWGYWANPKAADGTLEDFARAADEFSRKHHKAAHLANGQAVLDVGCGFGGNIELINQAYRDMRLDGLNIDPRQIERANAVVKPQQCNGNAIEFTVGDAVALPYADARYDAVLALECIFHFPSRARFMREALRVLKPGGILIVSDFITRPLAKPFMDVGWRLTKKATTATLGPVLPFETVAGYQRLARDAGLAFVTWSNITANTMPSMPVYKKLLASGDGFVTRMYKTQSRVSDAMKLGLARFAILTFQKAR